MFHNRSAHPVDLSIPANGLVERINHDDLEVLVGRILANQVGAKDTESLDTTTDSLSLLSDGLKVPDGFQLSHSTGSLGFAVTYVPSDDPIY